jgi:serine protease Do
MIKRIRKQFKKRNVVLKSSLAVVFSAVTLGVLVAAAFDEPGLPAPVAIESANATVGHDQELNGPMSIADLAEKMAPTVVNVRVTKVEKIAQRGWQVPGGPSGDFFERFFPQMPGEMEPRQTEGAGSGVLISEDGYILTNNHVVEDATKVTVTLADKDEYEAKIVGTDPKTDLAVLKIEASEPLPKAFLGDSAQLRVGETVVAIGNPFGLSHTVTAGIVSAKGRVIGAGPYDDFIQTDASINPGNSGGPLFNTRGAVVGINTAVIPNGQGIGFAIPVNTAKPLLPQLINQGTVTRGYLGVTIQPIARDLAEALHLESTDGALVADVASGSPADKGGIETGDVIRSFNGVEVEKSHQLPALVANTQVGADAQVVVEREGEKVTLSVRIAELDSDREEPHHSSREGKAPWGLQLQDLTPQIARQLEIEADEGVLVAGVQPESPAHRAGILRGDVILEVNRNPVFSVDDAVEAIEEQGEDPLLLKVQKGQTRLFVALTKES